MSRHRYNFSAADLPARTGQYSQRWVERTGLDLICAEWMLGNREFYLSCIAAATEEDFPTSSIGIDVANVGTRGGAILQSDLTSWQSKERWHERFEIHRALGEAVASSVTALTERYFSTPLSDLPAATDQPKISPKPFSGPFHNFGLRSFIVPRERLFVRIWNHHAAARRYIIGQQRFTLAVVEQRIPVLKPPQTFLGVFFGAYVTVTFMPRLVSSSESPDTDASKSNPVRCVQMSQLQKRIKATDKGQSSGLLFEELRRFQTALRLPASDLVFHYIDDGSRLTVLNTVQLVCEKNGELGRYETYQVAPATGQNTGDIGQSYDLFLRHSSKTVMEDAAEAVLSEVTARGAENCKIDELIASGTLSKISHGYGVNVKNLYSVYFLLSKRPETHPARSTSMASVATEMAARVVKGIIRTELFSSDDECNDGTGCAHNPNFAARRIAVVNKVMYFLTDAKEAQTIWEEHVLEVCKRKFQIPGNFAASRQLCMRILATLIPSKIGIAWDDVDDSFRSWQHGAIIGSSIIPVYEHCRIGLTNAPQVKKMLEKDLESANGSAAVPHRMKTLLRTAFISNAMQQLEIARNAITGVSSLLDQQEPSAKDAARYCVVRRALTEHNSTGVKTIAGLLSKVVPTLLKHCEGAVLPKNEPAEQFPMLLALRAVVSSSIWVRRKEKGYSYASVKTGRDVNAATWKSMSFCDGIYLTHSFLESAAKLAAPTDYSSNSSVLWLVGVLNVLGGASSALSVGMAAASREPNDVGSGVSAAVTSSQTIQKSLTTGFAQLATSTLAQVSGDAIVSDQIASSPLGQRLSTDAICDGILRALLVTLPPRSVAPDNVLKELEDMTARLAALAARGVNPQIGKSVAALSLQLHVKAFGGVHSRTLHSLAHYVVIQSHAKRQAEFQPKMRSSERSCRHSFLPSQTTFSPATSPTSPFSTRTFDEKLRTLLEWCGRENATYSEEIASSILYLARYTVAGQNEWREALEIHNSLCSNNKAAGPHVDAFVKHMSTATSATNFLRALHFAKVPVGESQGGNELTFMQRVQQRRTIVTATSKAQGMFAFELLRWIKLLLTGANDREEILRESIVNDEAQIREQLMSRLHSSLYTMELESEEESNRNDELSEEQQSWVWLLMVENGGIFEQWELLVRHCIELSWHSATIAECETMEEGSRMSLCTREYAEWSRIEAEELSSGAAVRNQILISSEEKGRDAMLFEELNSFPFDTAIPAMLLEEEQLFRILLLQFNSTSTEMCVQNLNNEEAAAREEFERNFEGASRLLFEELHIEQMKSVAMNAFAGILQLLIESSNDQVAIMQREEAQELDEIRMQYEKESSTKALHIMQDSETQHRIEVNRSEVDELLKEFFPALAESFTAVVCDAEAAEHSELLKLFVKELEEVRIASIENEQLHLRATLLSNALLELIEAADRMESSLREIFLRQSAFFVSSEFVKLEHDLREDLLTEREDAFHELFRNFFNELFSSQRAELFDEENCARIQLSTDEISAQLVTFERLEMLERDAISTESANAASTLFHRIYDELLREQRIELERSCMTKFMETIWVRNCTVRLAMVERRENMLRWENIFADEEIGRRNIQFVDLESALRPCIQSIEEFEFAHLFKEYQRTMLFEFQIELQMREKQDRKQLKQDHRTGMKRIVEDEVEPHARRIVEQKGLDDIAELSAECARGAWDMIVADLAKRDTETRRSLWHSFVVDRAAFVVKYEELQRDTISQDFGSLGREIVSDGESRFRDALAKYENERWDFLNFQFYDALAILQRDLLVATEHSGRQGVWLSMKEELASILGEIEVSHRRVSLAFPEAQQFREMQSAFAAGMLKIVVTDFTNFEAVQRRIFVKSEVDRRLSEIVIPAEESHRTIIGTRCDERHERVVLVNFFEEKVRATIQRNESAAFEHMVDSGTAIAQMKQRAEIIQSEKSDRCGTILKEEALELTELLTEEETALRTPTYISEETSFNDISQDFVSLKYEMLLNALTLKERTERQLLTRTRISDELDMMHRFFSTRRSVFLFEEHRDMFTILFDAMEPSRRSSLQEFESHMRSGIVNFYVATCSREQRNGVVRAEALKRQSQGGMFLAELLQIIQSMEESRRALITAAEEATRRDAFIFIKDSKYKLDSERLEELREMERTHLMHQQRQAQTFLAREFALQAIDKHVISCEEAEIREMIATIAFGRSAMIMQMEGAQRTRLRNSFICDCFPLFQAQVSEGHFRGRQSILQSYLTDVLIQLTFARADDMKRVIEIEEASLRSGMCSVDAMKTLWSDLLRFVEEDERKDRAAVFHAQRRVRLSDFVCGQEAAQRNVIVCEKTEEVGCFLIPQMEWERRKLISSDEVMQRRIILGIVMKEGYAVRRAHLFQCEEQKRRDVWEEFMDTCWRAKVVKRERFVRTDEAKSPNTNDADAAADELETAQPDAANGEIASDPSGTGNWKKMYFRAIKLGTFLKYEFENFRRVLKATEAREFAAIRQLFRERVIFPRLRAALAQMETKKRQAIQKTQLADFCSLMTESHEDFIAPFIQQPERAGRISILLHVEFVVRHEIAAAQSSQQRQLIGAYFEKATKFKMERLLSDERRQRDDTYVEAFWEFYLRRVLQEFAEPIERIVFAQTWERDFKKITASCMQVVGRREMAQLQSKERLTRRASFTGARDEWFRETVMERIWEPFKRSWLISTQFIDPLLFDTIPKWEGRIRSLIGREEDSIANRIFAIGKQQLLASHFKELEQVDEPKARGRIIAQESQVEIFVIETQAEPMTRQHLIEAETVDRILDITTPFNKRKFAILWKELQLGEACSRDQLFLEEIAARMSNIVLQRDADFRIVVAGYEEPQARASIYFNGSVMEAATNTLNEMSSSLTAAVPTTRPTAMRKWGLEQAARYELLVKERCEWSQLVLSLTSGGHELQFLHLEAHQKGQRAEIVESRSEWIFATFASFEAAIRDDGVTRVEAEDRSDSFRKWFAVWCQLQCESMEREHMHSYLSAVRAPQINERIILFDEFVTETKKQFECFDYHPRRRLLLVAVQEKIHSAVIRAEDREFEDLVHRNFSRKRISLEREEVDAAEKEERQFLAAQQVMHRIGIAGDEHERFAKIVGSAETAELRDLWSMYTSATLGAATNWLAQRETLSRAEIRSSERLNRREELLIPIEGESRVLLFSLRLSSVASAFADTYEPLLRSIISDNEASIRRGYWTSQLNELTTACLKQVCHDEAAARATLQRASPLVDGKGQARISEVMAERLKLFSSCALICIDSSISNSMVALEETRTPRTSRALVDKDRRWILGTAALRGVIQQQEFEFHSKILTRSFHEDLHKLQNVQLEDSERVERRRVWDTRISEFLLHFSGAYFESATLVRVINSEFAARKSILFVSLESDLRSTIAREEKRLRKLKIFDDFVSSRFSLGEEELRAADATVRQSMWIRQRDDFVDDAFFPMEQLWREKIESEEEESFAESLQKQFYVGFRDLQRTQLFHSEKVLRARIVKRQMETRRALLEVYADRTRDALMETRKRFLGRQVFGIGVDDRSEGLQLLLRGVIESAEARDLRVLSREFYTERDAIEQIELLNQERHERSSFVMKVEVRRRAALFDELVGECHREMLLVAETRAFRKKIVEPFLRGHHRIAVSDCIAQEQHDRLVRIRAPQLNIMFEFFIKNEEEMRRLISDECFAGHRFDESATWQLPPLSLQRAWVDFEATLRRDIHTDESRTFHNFIDGPFSSGMFEIRHGEIQRSLRGAMRECAEQRKREIIEMFCDFESALRGSILSHSFKSLTMSAQKFNSRIANELLKLYPKNAESNARSQWTNNCIGRREMIVRKMEPMTRKALLHESGYSYCFRDEEEDEELLEEILSPLSKLKRANNKQRLMLPREGALGSVTDEEADRRARDSVGPIDDAPHSEDHNIVGSSSSARCYLLDTLRVMESCIRSAVDVEEVRLFKLQLATPFQQRKHLLESFELVVEEKRRREFIFRLGLFGVPPPRRSLGGAFVFSFDADDALANFWGDVLFAREIAGRGVIEKAELAARKSRLEKHFSSIANDVLIAFEGGGRHGVKHQRLQILRRVAIEMEEDRRSVSLHEYQVQRVQLFEAMLVRRSHNDVLRQERREFIGLHVRFTTETTRKLLDVIEAFESTRRREIYSQRLEDICDAFTEDFEDGQRSDVCASEASENAQLLVQHRFERCDIQLVETERDEAAYRTELLHSLSDTHVSLLLSHESAIRSILSSEKDQTVRVQLSQFALRASQILKESACRLLDFETMHFTDVTRKKLLAECGDFEKRRRGEVVSEWHHFSLTEALPIWEKCERTRRVLSVEQFQRLTNLHPRYERLSFAFRAEMIQNEEARGRSDIYAHYTRIMSNDIVVPCFASTAFYAANFFSPFSQFVLNFGAAAEETFCRQQIAAEERFDWQKRYSEEASRAVELQLGESQMQESEARRSITCSEAQLRSRSFTVYAHGCQLCIHAQAVVDRLEWLADAQRSWTNVSTAVVCHQEATERCARQFEFHSAQAELVEKMAEEWHCILNSEVDRFTRDEFCELAFHQLMLLGRAEGRHWKLEIALPHIDFIPSQRIFELVSAEKAERKEIAQQKYNSIWMKEIAAREETLRSSDVAHSEAVEFYESFTLQLQMAVTCEKCANLALVERRHRTETAEIEFAERLALLEDCENASRYVALFAPFFSASSALRRVATFENYFRGGIQADERQQRLTTLEGEKHHIEQFVAPAETLTSSEAATRWQLTANYLSHIRTTLLENSLAVDVRRQIESEEAFEFLYDIWRRGKRAEFEQLLSTLEQRAEKHKRKTCAREAQERQIFWEQWEEILRGSAISELFAKQHSAVAALESTLRRSIVQSEHEISDSLFSSYFDHRLHITVQHVEMKEKRRRRHSTNSFFSIKLRLLEDFEIDARNDVVVECWQLWRGELAHREEYYRRKLLVERRSLFISSNRKLLSSMLHGEVAAAEDEHRQDIMTDAAIDAEWKWRVFLVRTQVITYKEKFVFAFEEATRRSWVSGLYFRGLFQRLEWFERTSRKILMQQQLKEATSMYITEFAAPLKQMEFERVGAIVQSAFGSLVQKQERLHRRTLVRCDYYAPLLDQFALLRASEKRFFFELRTRKVFAPAFAQLRLFNEFCVEAIALYSQQRADASKILADMDLDNMLRESKQKTTKQQQPGGYQKIFQTPFLTPLKLKALRVQRKNARPSARVDGDAARALLADVPAASLQPPPELSGVTPRQLVSSSVMLVPLQNSNYNRQKALSLVTPGATARSSQPADAMTARGKEELARFNSARNSLLFEMRVKRQEIVLELEEELLSLRRSMDQEFAKQFRRHHQQAAAAAIAHRRHQQQQQLSSHYGSPSKFVAKRRSLTKLPSFEVYLTEQQAKMQRSFVSDEAIDLEEIPHFDDEDEFIDPLSTQGHRLLNIIRSRRAHSEEPTQHHAATVPGSKDHDHNQQQHPTEEVEEAVVDTTSSLVQSIRSTEQQQRRLPTLKQPSVQQAQVNAQRRQVPRLVSMRTVVRNQQ